MKVKSESEVAQLCPTLSDPMDWSLPGSSVHGIFQARVLEWGAIAGEPEFSINAIVRIKHRDFPHGPGVKNSASNARGMVRSPVRELTSHML